MAKIFLTQTAIKDFKGIENYSIQEYGKEIANEYIETFDFTLNLLEKFPDLFSQKPEFGDGLLFYSVKKHLIVATKDKQNIYILTVKHTSSDILNWLLDYQPNLVKEVEILKNDLDSGSSPE